MKRFLATVFTVAGGVLAVAVLATSGARAADNNASGQGLQISPAVIPNLKVDPGQTIVTHVKISNVSADTLIATGEVNDFVASGEDGTPKILLDDTDTEAANDPFKLSNLVLPLPKYTIKPKQIIDVPVTISVPVNASPGGHYGVIRFTGAPADLDTTGVSLSASIGALVLLTVNGQLNEQLSVASFTAGHDNKTGSFFEAAPIEFAARVTNSGNIHEQPVGNVVVKDMFGHEVGKPNVNLELNNVLPNSTRKFTTNLDKTVIGNRRLFGHYTADLKLTYGASKQTLTAKVSFWVIPYRLILGIVILLVAAFFGLRYLLKRYNAHIVKQADKKRSAKH